MSNLGITVSNAVRAKFPVLDFLEGDAYPPVVIISGAELSSPGEKVPPPERQESFKRHLVNAGFPEADADKIAKRIVENLKEGDLTKVAVTYTDLEAPEAGSIIIMNGFADKEDLIYRTTGKRGLKLDLPGDIEDYNNFALLHELAHSRKPTEQNGERYADEAAAKEYLNLYLQGKQENPDVPYAFRALRILAAVEAPLGTWGEHPPAIFSVFPGEKPNGLKGNDFEGEASKALTKIAFEVGKGLISDDDAYSASVGRLLTKMTTDTKFIEKYGILNPGMESKVRKALDEKDIDSLKRFVSLLPEELQKKMQASISMSYGMEGYRAMSEQPELRYIHAKKLLEEGAFDSPAQKIFIERFLDTAQRYAADYYKVPQEERKSPTPYADGEISLAELNSESLGKAGPAPQARESPAVAAP